MSGETGHLLVVALADAGSKPGAVVVKFFNAAIAQVAVRTPDGSENQASVAKLEFREKWGVHLIQLQVVDLLWQVVYRISLVLFRKRSIFD